MIKRPNLVLIEILKIPLSYNGSTLGSDPRGRGPIPFGGARSFRIGNPI